MTDDATRSHAADLIAAERQRQIEAEGWTPEHDDEHDNGQMARAAAAYALGDVDQWPWERRWWKSGDRVRDLVKAGALIAAEIDRLERRRGRTTPDHAAGLRAALDAYQVEWIKIENERGEYIRANERHVLAMEAALKAARDA